MFLRKSLFSLVALIILVVTLCGCTLPPAKEIPVSDTETLSLKSGDIIRTRCLDVPDYPFKKDSGFCSYTPIFYSDSHDLIIQMTGSLNDVTLPFGGYCIKGGYDIKEYVRQLMAKGIVDTEEYYQLDEKVMLQKLLEQSKDEVEHCIQQISFDYARETVSTIVNDKPLDLPETPYQFWKENTLDDKGCIFKVPKGFAIVGPFVYNKDGQFYFHNAINNEHLNIVVVLDSDSTIYCLPQFPVWFFPSKTEAVNYLHISEKAIIPVSLSKLDQTGSGFNLIQPR